MNHNVLLVEDDPNFGMILKDYLELNDFHVVLAKDGIEGIIEFRKNNFDICVLDVMMPRKDGFTLAKEIKNVNPDQAIIFLTAKSLKEDIMKGYSSGADDYLTKPFDSDVLMAKVKAIIARNKRNELPEQESYEVGKFTFDPKLRVLAGYGETRKLSPKESELLKLMLQYKNDLLPRSVALLKIWKDDNYFTGRSMDVYVAKLRKYLKADESIEIQNIHSEGFTLILADS
jgi:two-component system OmpR family response regulator